jgi:hypothetical protein
MFKNSFLLALSSIAQMPTEFNDNSNAVWLGNDNSNDVWLGNDNSNAVWLGNDNSNVVWLGQ